MAELRQRLAGLPRLGFDLLNRGLKFGLAVVFPSRRHGGSRARLAAKEKPAWTGRGGLKSWGSRPGDQGREQGRDASTMRRDGGGFLSVPT